MDGQKGGGFTISLLSDSGAINASVIHLMVLLYSNKSSKPYTGTVCMHEKMSSNCKCHPGLIC